MKRGTTEVIANLMVQTGHYYSAKDLQTDFGLTHLESYTVLRGLCNGERYEVAVQNQPLRVKVLVVNPVQTPAKKSEKPPHNRELTERQTAQINYLNSQVFKRHDYARRAYE